ncbi:MAG: SET domain-containing protein-lysine N-methyltransferase [Sediminibacterium sp.]
MLHHELYIEVSEGRGRGVFTRSQLAAGEVVEVSPVLVLSQEEMREVEKTRLHDYIFEWGEERKNCCVAWGYLSMYNHAEPPNCTYEMDFEEETITIRTLRVIEAGGELFISYLPEEGSKPPIWFQVK